MTDLNENTEKLIETIKPTIDSVMKITIEFKDHYLIFEGEDAIKWLNAADSAASYAMVRGVDYFKIVDFDKAYVKK